MSTAQLLPPTHPLIPHTHASQQVQLKLTSHTLHPTKSHNPINKTKVHEGYSSTVYADAGKVYTQGYGSTIKPNGKPITKNDAPIDRKTATMYLQHHYDVRVTPQLNKSLQGIKISQIEYDVAANFIYQYGAGAWLRSTMLTELKSGNYVASCKA